MLSKFCFAVEPYEVTEYRDGAVYRTAMSGKVIWVPYMTDFEVPSAIQFGKKEIRFANTMLLSQDRVDYVQNIPRLLDKLCEIF